jgi:hypothetical protein
MKDAWLSVALTSLMNTAEAPMGTAAAREISATAAVVSGAY